MRYSGDVTYKILDNNNLMIVAGTSLIEDLREAEEDDNSLEDVVREHLHDKLQFIRPEEIGAMTDAPILTECDKITHDEDGEIFTLDGPVWWYPDYSIKDPWTHLLLTGEVIFQVAP